MDRPSVHKEGMNCVDTKTNFRTQNLHPYLYSEGREPVIWLKAA
jgi:hypothetical protein